MFRHTDFQAVFPKDVQIPYDRKLQHDIEARRKQVDGVLFIDRVTEALGIQKAKSYPPKTETALRQLHEQICNASMSLHHKFSLLYYLLLDFDNPNHGKSVSERFVCLSGIPANYQLFMKGLWYLDRREYSRALEYVAHPSLNPDFADDIIITLVKQASDRDYTLALSYYHAVQPMLKSPLALELLFDAMAKTNATEALLFSRARPQHTRERLFGRWLASVLDHGRKEDPSSRVSQLALMPFDPMEEVWFEEYLTVGEGRNSRKAKDLLLIRKIACDRFSDIARIRPSGPWAAVLEGIKAGTEGQVE